ncbi:MAG: penicillin acylase family protein [Microthrixaceae bacterium]
MTVEVLREDGSTSERPAPTGHREFGPVLDFPGVGWARESTISYRDANLHNDAMVDQYLAMDRARSLEDLQDAHREHQGIPLFNTVAVDADGTAWYADTSATPNISPEAQQAYTERLEAGGLTAIAEEAGAVLLEGNTSRDRWVDDPDAPWPGVLPYDELPQVERSDYLMNANDSYWLPNAQAPIDGEFSILQGEAATARSVRTRENLAVLSDTSPAGPAGEDGLFDLDELTAAALRDEGYTEKQWREAVVQRCLAADGEVAHPEIPGSPGADPIPAATVDLAGACEVLKAWDGRYDTDSRGAVLWREFTERVDYDEMWAEGFDPEEPATTPSGLAPAPGEGADPVLVGLAEALGVLAAAGVEPDAPLGEVQFDGRSLEGRLPVPGGLGSEGVTNVVSGSSNASTMEERPSWPDPVADDSTLTTEGYPITFGTSFLMAVAYGPDGPRARTILTYGQVGDPDLAGFTSGVEAFAAKSWKEVETDPEVLAADPDSTVVEVSA